MLDDVDRKARLAYAIRMAMERRNVSAENLAAAIGKTYRTIKRWRDGESSPSALDVGPLADALGVNPELFINPPPVPEYPIADYLREAVQQGVREGLRRGRTRARQAE